MQDCLLILTNCYDCTATLPFNTQEYKYAFPNLDYIIVFIIDSLFAFHDAIVSEFVYHCNIQQKSLIFMYYSILPVLKAALIYLYLVIMLHIYQSFVLVLCIFYVWFL